MRTRVYLAILILLTLVAALPAQAQFTTITMTNVQNGDGLPLALGTTCWLGANNSGQAIGYRAGGSGQVTTNAVCRDIINGAVQTTYKGATIGALKVADSTLTVPANVCYKVTVTDTSSGKVVIGSYAGAKSGYDCVQPSGTTWSFDTYTPAGTPGVVQVAGPTGPTGLTGPIGPTGPTGAAATISVDAGTVINPNSAPMVSNLGTSSAAVIHFNVPRARIWSIGTVSTLASGASATATTATDVNGDMSLSLGIPQGPPGLTFNASSNIPFTGANTHSGAETFSGAVSFNNVLSNLESTILNPAFFSTTDPCTAISGAFAFAISQGWTSATVDARQRRWLGQQHCTTSPFAGVSNNGTFTGVLLTQGTQFVMDVPIVIPGGIRWDGSGPRSLTDPRNDAGTSVQPSSAYAATYPLNLNPIIQYGATADTSSPQKIWLTNMAIGCLAPGASYVAGTGSTGVYNGNGQEGSGGDFLDIVGCQYGFGVDVASGTGSHSGFDSSGFHHIAITVPSDAAAGGFLFGNTAMGTGLAIADVFGFDDITVTGVPSGTQAGFCADIEGSSTYIKGIRCYYTAKGVIIGDTLTAVGVSVDDIATESNVSYPMSTIVEIGSHAGYDINVRNVLAGGTTTNILSDANYPGGACTLLQSNEAGISLYSRGIGGGALGDVLSTARTACTTTGIFAALFGQNINWTGQHTFSQNVTIAATGTATSGANFPSKRMNYNASVWDGANPLNCSLGWDVTVGSGANPSETMTLEKCGTAASNNINFNNLSTNGITFAPGTFKTASVANTVQNGLNLLAGTGVTVVNTSNANVTISGTLHGTLTTTAAASDAVTVTGATTSSHCAAPAPTNASAATNIATTFISAKAANAITVSHAATSGMTYDLICTVD